MMARVDAPQALYRKTMMIDAADLKVHLFSAGGRLPRVTTDAQNALRHDSRRCRHILALIGEILR